MPPRAIKGNEVAKIVTSLPTQVIVSETKAYFV